MRAFVLVAGLCVRVPFGKYAIGLVSFTSTNTGLDSISNQALYSAREYSILFLSMREERGSKKFCDV